jgi:hypothetical protein
MCTNMYEKVPCVSPYGWMYMAKQVEYIKYVHIMKAMVECMSLQCVKNVQSLLIGLTPVPI